VTFQHRAVVDAPLGEVFAWHSRAGAIVRLTPPWYPVRVLSESTSLRDGEAVLGLPGRTRWVARHRPEEYEPSRRFVDELTSQPFRSVIRWRHVHEFDALGTESTRVTDTVDTTIPAAFLRAMFAYRERQLGGDLSAHRWGRTFGAEPLRVAITGSSGLVGSALAAFLSTGGHQVIRLVRRAPSGPAEREWRPDAPDPDVLAGVDAVVHLAGTSIAGRFTASHREAIRDSRVGPTSALATAVARAAAAGGGSGAAGGGGTGPRCLVTASAIGIYGADRGDEVLTERSERGTGFLADVVADWEAATGPAVDAGVRVVQVRTGIVQSPRGGTLRLLRPLFAAGLGGPLAGGEQWMSWVGIDDLVDIYYRSILDPQLSGAVNGVAPDPVRNREYSATLARVLRRPAVIPVPGLGPRLLLGAEGAEELAEASQRVEPARLVAAGHSFRYPDLEPALRHVLGRVPLAG
jgi:uncharacterized protein (TIGR01777 family)